jgi:demethylmenaquinone methyltransferase/2-methoxy-6-polyprenyl-1,4-benzoquinol methylase
MLPQGAEKRTYVRQMFDTIAGRYDLLNRVVSLGLDRGWRRQCVEALELPAGSLVLDVACGTGDLCLQLSRQGFRPVGIDLSRGMLARAQARVAPSEALVLGDALASPFREGSFDGAVSAFALRNVTDIAEMFAELARVVRPGGRIALLDLCEPEVPLVRAAHHLWSNYAVPYIGSLLSDAAAYRYLPRSLTYLPPADDMVKLLESKGFAAVQRQLLFSGVSQLYFATRSMRLQP